MLRQATTTMLSGRPGPVNLDIPFNLFQEEANIEVLNSGAASISQRSGASPEDVSTVANLLLNSERPLLFVGHGVTLSEASEELSTLVQRLNIPIVSSPNGMGCVDMRIPQSVGFIGRNGAYPANQAGRHCDLLLAIGARFDDRASSSWIQGYSWNMPTT